MEEALAILRKHKQGGKKEKKSKKAKKQKKEKKRRRKRRGKRQRAAPVVTRHPPRNDQEPMCAWCGSLLLSDLAAALEWA